MSGMLYHKWFHEDLDLYASVLTKEQIGQLVLAVKDYSKTGVKPEVPSEIALAFGAQCLKVDGARAKYDAKCEVNARNGAAGGRAKGRNAAKARAKKIEQEPEKPKSIPPLFKPLSKSDFLAIAEHWIPHAEHSKVENFYRSVFVGSDWKLDDEFPVASNATVIAAICVAFAGTKFFRDREEDWEVFLEAYSVLKGDVPFLMFEQFAKTYRRYHDKPGGIWNIKGDEYVDCFDAVHVFFDDE